MNISSTSEDVEVCNVWLLLVKYLIGGMLVMAMHRYTIVQMGCIGDGEFTPTIRNAGILPHSF